MLPKILSLPALALAAALSAGTADAALVTPTSSASFVFDVTGLGPFSVSRTAYDCAADYFPCFDVDDLTLAVGATGGLDVGLSPGASDIASGNFINGFGYPIVGLSGGLLPTFNVGAGVDRIYLTFRYVDDVYTAGVARIIVNGQTLAGTEVRLIPVPLPAAGLMLLAGLGALGALRARRRA